MESKRRAVRWSLALAACLALAAWLTWDLWLDVASTPHQADSQSVVEAALDSSAARADTLDPATADEEAGPQTSPQVDFSGKWQLDAAASDSMDPILEAIGLSYLERALVNNTVVTHVITQTEDELTLEVRTSFFSRTDHLPVNGEPATTTDPSGRTVKSISSWSDDGMQLITDISIPADKQNFTLTRSLDRARDAMEVLIKFFPTKGKTMAARRVYHRVK